MATKQQIGAVIGVSGEKEYQNQLKLLIQYTKEWKSETDKLTSTIDKSTRTITDSIKERKALETEIDSLNKVLKVQKERYEEFATTLHNTPTDQQQKKLSELRTEINKTETSINELKNRIKELPDENFFSRQEYKRNAEELTNKTELLAAKTNVLTTSLKNNLKTFQDVKKERSLLQEQVTTLNQKLELQKKRFEELSKTMDSNSTAEEKKEFDELGIEIQETTAHINELNNEIKELPDENTFSGKLKLVKENLANVKSELKEMGDFMKGIGDTMTRTLTLPIVGGFAASTKAAVDWESALNGVRKTTDMSESEMKALETELKRQALTTTYTSNELAGLAQIAGQLGVRGVDDISKFVQVVADLGISTDMTAEDAATNLARILNITEGGSLENLEALGSVIVHLGNNLATTEPEITEMANRMASAASIVGFTTPEIFALSGALTSVGITAEAGGSTVGQVLTNIDKQFASFTKDGTGNLQRIAEISGTSAEQFAQTWQNEPVKAFEMFINGLAGLEESGQNINIVLDELDMAGIRQSNMLKALSEAQQSGIDTNGLFTKSLELAEEAYKGVNAEGEEFNALQKEADVRKGESATTFANLIESLNQLGQAFGEVILPVIIPFIQALTDIITKISQLDPATRELILTIAAIVAAVGPALSIVGSIMSTMATVGVIISTLGIGIAGLLAPIAAVVAAVAGAIIIGVNLVKHWEEIKAGFEALKIVIQVGIEQLWTNITTFFSNLWNGLVQIGTEIISSVGQFFENVINKFILFVFVRLPNFLSSIVNGFASMGTSVWNKVREIGSNIRDTFSNLISSAWNWGRDLIGNIISGITSRISSLVNSVRNVASTIWSYLHFSEPETGPLSDFHTWMPDFMGSLAKGINDNVYLVDNAINRVADTLGSANQVNYGGVVINLNVPQGANGQQIVNEIETELANRTIRRKAVFG